MWGHIFRWPLQLIQWLGSFVAIIINAVTRFAGPGKSIRESTEEPELRIILVGKTGTGKSATGNTILGEERFDSRFEFTPVTQTCQEGVREWKGKRIVVIDTPAIFSSGASWDAPEIDRCRRLSHPGPHAVVLVTQTGRFTEEDYQSAQQVKEIFGKEAREYMIVVFTRREDLRSESLEKYVGNTGNKYLQEVIRECSSRYCGLNNSETGEEQGRQAEELLGKIMGMVQKNQGRPYCAVKGGGAPVRVNVPSKLHRVVSRNTTL